MSNEIWATYEEGNDLYALVWRASDDKVWDNTASAWDTYTDADIDDYDVALANQADSDYYSVDFPAGITSTTQQAYRAQIMLRPGAIDADADFTVGTLEIFWNGSEEITLGTINITNQTVTNVYEEEFKPPQIQVFNL